MRGGNAIVCTSFLVQHVSICGLSLHFCLLVQHVLTNRHKHGADCREKIIL